MNKVKANVQKFLKKYSIKENDNILVAFSGGYDSMSLLDVLIKLNYTPIAIHLNHNWRGEESLKEAKNCKNFCNRFGIEFYTETLSDNIKPTETEAREARYDFFNRCAKRFHSQIVFTAHNADDNAETLIYRISKGTGIEGLKGIAPVRGIYYRPLLTTYREEIENYCKENNLSPNKDSSNENTKYKRNLIRKTIIPELNKINKEAKVAINTLSENAVAETEIINEYLNLLKDKFKTKNFINYSPALQNRIIYQFLIDNDFEYDKKTVEKLVNFIIENSSTKNGKIISITKDKWLFVNSSEIRLIDKNEKDEYTLIIKECNIRPDKFPPDSEYIAYVNLKETGTKFKLRKREDGDIIHPLGAKGKQKLKKYLNGKGIPKDKRDKMLFLCQGKEVLWAPGLGISERIKVTENPTHILKLEKTNEH